MTQPVARDTVAIEEGVHDTYRQLTEGNDPEAVPFKTMKDVFMWAACLGFRRGVRRPLGGRRVTVFRWAQFTPQVDVPILKAISIAHTSDVAILLEKERLLEVVEEFANAGIHELRNSVLGQYGQPLWNLVSLMSVAAVATEGRATGPSGNSDGIEQGEDASGALV